MAVLPLSFYFISHNKEWNSNCIFLLIRCTALNGTPKITACRDISQQVFIRERWRILISISIISYFLRPFYTYDPLFAATCDDRRRHRQLAIADNCCCDVIHVLTNVVKLSGGRQLVAICSIFWRNCRRSHQCKWPVAFHKINPSRVGGGRGVRTPPPQVFRPCLKTVWPIVFWNFQ